MLPMCKCCQLPMLPMVSWVGARTPDWERRHLGGAWARASGWECRRLEGGSHHATFRFHANILSVFTHRYLLVLRRFGIMLVLLRKLAL